MKSFAALAATLTTLWLLPDAQAQQGPGTLVHVHGQVTLLSNPGRAVEGPSPRVLYSGEYFTYKEGAVGDVVEPGSWVRTAPGARARIVYPNGDQLLVGAQTLMRLSSAGREPSQEGTASDDGARKVELTHGKLRGMVVKTSPRKRLQVYTKAATMGVRGTDFVISHEGMPANTKLTVLRGAVELKAQAQPKPVEIKSGSTATVAPEKAEKLEVAKVTRTDIEGIQKSLSTPPPSEKAPEQVKALEAKAVQAELADIKTADPKLFEAIQQQKHGTSASLDAAVLSSQHASAPEAVKAREEEERRKAAEESGFNSPN
jgi:hypothetical protein